jgi:competence protein ComQ
MEPGAVEEMLRIVDKYATEDSLNVLLKTFIRDKEAEGSRWSSIARCTHGMLGGNSPFIDRSAALTELVMLSFDIIDDLQDGDNTGKPWITCPHAYTLNGILSLLFGFIGEIGYLPQKLLHDAKSLMTEIGMILSRSINGQQIDLNGSIVTEADYIAMIKKKSGSLLRFACFMGYSLVPDLDKQSIEKINELAEYMGMISQLDNDIRDVLSFDAKNDLLQKKRTLPILYLLAESDLEFPPLHQYYRGEIIREQFVRYKQECMLYIENSGCIEYSRVVQSLYLNQANDLFDSIPAISPWKEKFREITFAR